METGTLEKKIELLSEAQRLKLEGYVDYLLETLEQEGSLPDNLKSEESLEYPVQK
jgi:hypothetical protein